MVSRPLRREACASVRKRSTATTYAAPFPLNTGHPSQLSRGELQRTAWNGAETVNPGTWCRASLHEPQSLGVREAAPNRLVSRVKKDKTHVVPTHQIVRASGTRTPRHFREHTTRQLRWRTSWLMWALRVTSSHGSPERRGGPKYSKGGGGVSWRFIFGSDVDGRQTNSQPDDGSY